MTTSIYLITSIAQSGGSTNYDYIIDPNTSYDGIFTIGTGSTTDGDATFEDGEIFNYTVNGTTYLVQYDGFVDVNASSAVDFGVITVLSVVSGSDTDGLVGSQFAFTTDASVPAEANRAKIYDPSVGTPIAEWVCFTAGTLITTPFGDIPVEALKLGDLVQTKDDGLQKIRWIGSRQLQLIKGKVTPATPIRIAENSIGNAKPNRNLVVSQQHRILVDGGATEVLFGEAEVLVPAKHLVNQNNITYASDLSSVQYVHIMFDKHQIITSNGLKSESFFPDTVGLANIDRVAKRELLRIFPELSKDAGAYGPTARLTIKAHQATVLMELNATGHPSPIFA